MTRRTSSPFIRFILIFFTFFASAASSFAQGSYTVRFKLIDDKTGDPIPFATASVTPKGEKVASKYSLTNDKGEAVLTKVPKGTYLLRAEIMGYKTQEQEITVSKDLNLNEIRMHEDAEVLDAASVSAVGNPIIVKKDTIEYNASSFKTSDNDMLEELLKKLPGVEVDSDGKITANGEEIKKITIDGKTFFLDDPQLASKNIPAKIIDKVKVVEKKSDQAIFTGIDDGEEEMVIDLSIRPGMMNGWFGNLMGGGGHDVPGERSDMNDWRYQGGAMIARMTKKSQLTFLVSANNTNNRGFNDITGGMMQSMRGGGMGSSSGGWGRDNGITQSWMGGVNGVVNLFDDKMDLGGSYLYNGSINNVKEGSSRITYQENGNHLLNDETGVGTRKTQGHRFGIRLEHEFSESSSLIFEPQFNFGKGKFNEISQFSTLTDRLLEDGTYARENTNDGYKSNWGDSRNWSTSGHLIYRQRLGKPGRTISVMLRFSYSSNDMLGYNQSLTNQYGKKTGPDAGQETKEKIVNQQFDRNSMNASLSGRVSYTEPLGQDFYFEANYEYRWGKNTSVKNTFNSADNAFSQDGMLIYNPVGAVLDPVYSNNILNLNINQRAGFNIRYQREKFNAQIGAVINPTDTYNETSGKSPYHNKVVKWAPQMMLSYDFSDNSNVRMYYYGRSDQPSTNQLLPVPDNSNPNRISLGNPNLNPYFNHNIRTQLGYTNKKTFTSVHARFGGSMVQDGITNVQWFDENGVQYNLPVNGPLSGSFDGSIMFNSPIAKSGFSISSMTFARYGQSSSYVGTEALDSDKYYDEEEAVFDYVSFNKDYPDLNNCNAFAVNRNQNMSFTERLRLTYRNDFVELRAGGSTRFSKSWNTLKNSKVTATWNNRVDGSMNWTIPGGINLIAELNYNWYNGYTTPQEDEFVLNAEITKLLFKKRCTLAVRGYDILGQSKNLFVTDSSNSHSEVWNNTLGRYIIVSLTYRFGTFNGRGEGRGPGGPGGYHGGYHGGPPRR